MPRFTRDDTVAEMWESLHNTTAEGGEKFLNFLENLLTNKNNSSIINTDRKKGS